MKADLTPLTRIDGAIAAGVFAAGLVLYLRTAAPGLLLGDSAEFQTQAYTLGLTHPTGYPVYVLAARTVTSLIGGDLAWRVNAFSAVCAAAALALVYLNARLLSGWRVGAVIGSLAAGLAPIVWMHAAIAELYAPAALLIAGVLLAVLQWRALDDPRWLVAAGALGGVSLGVHGTVALAAPAVLVYLAITPGRARWRSALTGAAIGVGLYAVAFWVSDAVQAPSSYIETVVRPSASVWGLAAADLDQPWERLRFLLEARQFQGLVSADLGAGLRANGPAYAAALLDQFSPVSILLAALGAIGLLIRAPREGVLLGLAWLIQWVFVLNYGVADILVFYIPGYMLIGIAAGTGAGLMQAGVARAISRREPPTSAALAVARAAGLALAVLSVQPQLETIRTAWADAAPPALSEMGFGDYPYPVYDPNGPRAEAEDVASAIEDDAIVFTGWDRLYPLVFVTHVEQGRSGIAVHEAIPQEGQSGLADSALDYIETNWQTRPVYFTDRPGPELQRRYEFDTLPGGLFRVSGARASP
jgi:hypothetical protein